jgi:hypothetical protein
MVQFQALPSRRFQLGFDRVNVHRLTEVEELVEGVLHHLGGAAQVEIESKV